jgi:hypothetical protein
MWPTHTAISPLISAAAAGLDDLLAHLGLAVPGTGLGCESRKLKAGPEARNTTKSILAASSREPMCAQGWPGVESPRDNRFAVSCSQHATRTVQTTTLVERATAGLQGSFLLFRDDEGGATPTGPAPCREARGQGPANLGGSLPPRP